MKASFIFACAVLFLFFHRIADAGAVPHVESGIRGPAYDELAHRLIELPRANSDLITTEIYGKSVAGRPLLMVKMAAPGIRRDSRPVVVLTHVIHGNEYLGIVDKLPEELVKNWADYPTVKKFVDGGGVLFFFPIVNPDGYEANRRTNENDIDLNRDFGVLRYADRIAQFLKGEIEYTDYEFTTLKDYVDRPKFTQPETKLLSEAIAKEMVEVNGRLKLSFDYHCCQDEYIGSLMHSWGDTKHLHDGTIPEKDVPRYDRVGTVFKAHFDGHLWGSGYEIIEYLTFGTTDEWFYETFAKDGALSFCYEGQRYEEHRKLKLHARLWETLLGDPELME